jgi:hypothetical protein
MMAMLVQDVHADDDTESTQKNIKKISLKTPTKPTTPNKQEQTHHEAQREREGEDAKRTTKQVARGEEATITTTTTNNKQPSCSEWLRYRQKAAKRNKTHQASKREQRGN